MAALGPISTPARQPFGALNDSMVRSMQSLKNRQNAITPSSAPSLKRRALSPESGSDSENIDPNILKSLSKRKRSSLDDDVSVSKASRISLDVTSVAPAKRRLETPTPRLDTFVKPASITPASAPAAGRSPTRNRPGLLHTRKRFNPPTFSLCRQSPALSISAALNGTKKSRLQSQARKAQHTQPRTIEETKSNSWFFDIFEEPEEVQDYRMNEWTMTQSATVLDISDDESKAAKSFSERLDRGKENVDPNELSAPITRSMAAAAAAAAVAKAASRKERDANAMTDDERKPLADLNPSEFYAAGLDATSVVLVHDDVQEQTAEAEPEVTAASEPSADRAAAPTKASLSSTTKAIEALNVPSIGQILSSAAPFKFASREDKATALVAESEAALIEQGDAGIDIWESESAKDENEGHELDVPSPSSVGDENVFALQEL